MIQTRACLVRWYFMIVIRFFSKMAMPASFPSTNYRPNPRLVYLHAFGRCTSARGNPAFSNGLTTRDGGHLNVWKCVKTTVVHWIVWDLKKSNEHRQLSKYFFTGSHQFWPNFKLSTQWRANSLFGTCDVFLTAIWSKHATGIADRCPEARNQTFLAPAPNMQSFNGATCSQTVKWKNLSNVKLQKLMGRCMDAWPRGHRSKKRNWEENHQWNHRIVNENKGPRCNENMHQFLIGNVNVSNIVQLPFCSGASKPCLPLNGHVDKVVCDSQKRIRISGGVNCLIGPTIVQSPGGGQCLRKPLVWNNFINLRFIWFVDPTIFPFSL